MGTVHGGDRRRAEASVHTSSRAEEELGSACDQGN
jgi:hypothetical protein